MKKLKLLFMLLVLLAGFCTAQADELTVYDGTSTNSYVPVYGNWADAYLKCEYIIPSGQLADMVGADITKMVYYVSSKASKDWTGTFQVFLKEVESTTISDYSGTTGATVVYEGSLSGTSSTMEISFETPYNYGGGNLLVGIYQTTKGTYSSASFYGETQSDNTALYGYSSSSLDQVGNNKQTFLPKTTFTYEVLAEGPAFRVRGYKTGDSFSFGLRNADAEATTSFVLTNPGTAPVTVNITTTGEFTADKDNVTIAAKSEEEVTIMAPPAIGTSTGSVTFAPTETELESVTVDLSSTIKDPNKLFEDFTGGTEAPEDWTTIGYSGTYSSYAWEFGTDDIGVGYAGYGGTSSSSAGSLMTPLVQFEDGEKFFFKTAKYGSSTWNSPSISVQVSANGTDWTTVKTFTDDVYGTWTTREVTIPATTKYVRFYGWYIYITEIYGGQYSMVPVMRVTASDHYFSMVEEDASTTFTIMNAGKSVLDGISVVSSNPAFAIIDAPASLDPGTSVEVTVTLTTALKGIQEGTITVSAPDQETKTFSVSGAVADTELFYETFNDNKLPDLWKLENSSSSSYWSFSGGEVMGSWSSNKSYLITPSLIVAEGESLIFEARTTTTNATLVVTMSKNGGEYEACKTISTSDSENPLTSDNKFFTIDGLEAGNYTFRFQSESIRLDNFNGFHMNNDAPEMTLSSTATADFGTKIKAQPEGKTYTVTNSGTGTLNIEITSSDESMFTVSPATLSLGKGESGYFVVSLVFDENYGAKEATITVHPTNAGMTDVTFTAKGSTTDPTVWDVDFEDGKIPADMIDENGWEFYSALSSNYARNNKGDGNESKLISPKLVIAEGEVLAFDAAYVVYGGSKVLNVMYSADRKDWKSAKEITLSSSSMSSYTVDNIPAGEYYIAFEGSNVEVDNILGYHKVPVDVDLYAISQSVPTTGMVNAEYKASAIFKNVAEGLEANSYSAELLFGSEVMATADATEYAAGEKKTFNFSFTPRNAGTFDALVRLTVGGETFETEAIPVTIAEEVVTDELKIGTEEYNWYNGYSEFGAPLPTTTSSNLFGATATIYPVGAINTTAGSKINKLKYMGGGWSGYTYKSVKVYIGNTTDTDANTDVTGMTLIYNDAITTKGGGNDASPEEKFSIDLPEPFVYDGTNLKLVFIAETEGSRAVYTTFQKGLGSTVAGNGATAEEIETAALSGSPVVYLTVEKNPVQVTGVVTNQKDGSALPGVEVKAVSGNVEYTTTTDEDGAYALAIVKADLTYDFTATLNGFFPYTEEGVSFTANVEKNIELREANGLYIASEDIPAKGMCNNAYTATVDLQNFDPTDYAAADYTVKLYFDGEEMAAATTEDLAVEETKTFTMTFTPHAAGTKTAYVRVEWGEGESIQTDDVTVVINEEVSLAETTFGTKTTTRRAYNGTAPVSPYDENSKSETVYTKDQIGLTTGTKLLSFTFKGSNEAKVINGSLKVWLANTSETSSRKGETDDMTLVYDDKAQLQMGETILEVPFDDPFEYTGENLRVVFLMENQDGYSADIYFDVDSDASNRSSIKSADENETVANMTSWDNTVYIPVAYVGYSALASMSGTVTDETEDVVPGAVVTLTSGDVIYTATTDEAGTYEVKVAQKDLEYTLTVEAEGYEDYTDEDTYTFAEGNVEKDIVLSLKPETPESVTLIISAAGIASFSSQYAVDFTQVEGLTAYAVTEFEDYAKLEAIETAIPANTGVFVKGEAGDYDVPVVTDAEALSGTNLLKATSNETVTAPEDNTTIYGLGLYEGKPGMLLVTGGTTLAPNKAYLVYEGTGAKTFVPFGDGVATAIDGIDNATQDMEHPMYNLQGQRVGQGYKGVVIMNGKKTVNK